MLAVDSSFSSGGVGGVILESHTQDSPTVSCCNGMDAVFILANVFRVEICDSAAGALFSAPSSWRSRVALL